MSYSDFIWTLMFMGFIAYLMLGAIFTDVILPKFPKLCKLIDRLIDGGEMND